MRAWFLFGILLTSLPGCTSRQEGAPPDGATPARTSPAGNAGTAGSNPSTSTGRTGTDAARP